MRSVNYIDPVKEFGAKLLGVDKPARYVGGEFGTLADKEKIFRTVIAFPDLYEIGMGNRAVKIIYNRLNGLRDVSCDRVFAPAPDFEKLLRENGAPLYGLDTGIKLSDADVLLFTLGYELGLNGILTMLDVSGIPLHCNERNSAHPVIIAGGPAVSNPLPFSRFIDAFWMGEAEEGFFDLVEEIASSKKEGQGGREETLSRLSRHQNIWVKDKKYVKRAIYRNFSRYNHEAYDIYPIPSMKIIQHHGTVEIMRGCPNGCRFCHAGFWYRPARQKSRRQITDEAEKLVAKGGWQEISLSSLSSGDYSGIDELVEELNGKFSDKHVSFQLPSLKVSSFALPLLEKISLTRKSGLTFAVETPEDKCQSAINKEVSRDSVVTILEEAKKRGWKGAKFYFMIGLPRMETERASSEEEQIVSFVIDVAKRTGMRFNINIGIFIPKPHTPYQWECQMDGKTAAEKCAKIIAKLKPMGHKVSVSDPLISGIEGLLSRGDDRAGSLCEDAWRGGSRLDPWNEYINREVWQTILDSNTDYVKDVFSGKNEHGWVSIDSCVTKDYLMNEFEKSNKAVKTPSCRTECGMCGVCDKEILSAVNKNKEEIIVNQEKHKVNGISANRGDPSVFRLLFGFSKEGSAVFHGHLSLIEIFSMAFRRAEIPVMYTCGFNPLVKMEFASPLSTGISAEDEIAAVNFYEYFDPCVFTEKLNRNLPEGITIKKADCFLIKSGMKKHSLSSLLWGFAYSNNEEIDFICAKDEKKYRQNRLDKDCKSVFDLRRTDVLARDLDDINKPSSFFKAYDRLYK